MFDNIKILSPNNEIVAYCSNAKAKFYLKKNLAEYIDDKNIKLFFEPKYKNKILIIKENICIVCGTKDNLSKHHIIPYCYIKHMPTNVKKCFSNDIYFLCEEHHKKYEIFAEKEKVKLLDKFGYDCHGLPKDISCKIRMATNLNLSLNKHWLNTKARENILNKLKNINCENWEYFDVTEHPLYMNPSKLIINNFKNINQLCVFWRKHFVNTMNPKYLPKEWNLNIILEYI